MAKPIPRLSSEQIKRVIAVAFEDLPPYNLVLQEFAITQGELVQLMKRELTSPAYKLWAAQGKGIKKPTARSTFPHGR